MSRSLNSRILRLALPNILSNLTIPLLGMVDLALSGHLDDTFAIGAIAIATTMFNLIYWSFSFLRMGTTGLTAQSHGEGDRQGMGRNLSQSVLIALVGGLLILLLQRPLLDLTLYLLSPEEGLVRYAMTYYNIVVWGAPAVLLTYALNGWLIGMQNTWYPMAVSIMTNIINIGISAGLVIGAGRGIDGIAIGTLTAQWIGATALGFGAFLLYISRKKALLPHRLGDLRVGLKRYFGTNFYILIRTLLLALISAFFTYAGAQQGAVTLAANALLLQFFTFFSYFIDGFAFAGEAIVGHFYGMRDRFAVRRSIKMLVIWGVCLALLATLIYIVIGEPFLHFLTDKEDVIAYSKGYLMWVYLVPLAGFLAFIFDGVFIGVTAAKEMFGSMLAAVVVFFLLFRFLPFQDRNHVLWIAFLIYLAIRGVVQIFMTRKIKGIGLPFSNTYYLSIGTTLLDSETAITQRLMAAFPSAELAAFYTTTDASGTSDKRYLNTVMRLESSLTHQQLVVRTKQMERDAGRDRTIDEVVLDIDVVVGNDLVLREKDYNRDYFKIGYRELRNGTNG